MVIHTTPTGTCVVIFIRGIITNDTITGTIIHANIIMAGIIIITAIPEVITNTSTAITVVPGIITRNQDISSNTITIARISRNHFMVTRRILPMVSTREIRTLCYATDKIQGEA
jgi:hypothetical protein